MFDDMEDDDLNDVYPDGELLEEKRQSPLDREYQPRKMTVGEVRFHQLYSNNLNFKYSITFLEFYS